MTNPFEAYADEKGHKALPSHVQKAAKPVSQLDIKMEEKGRLMRGYRAWRREEAKRLFTAEPRLRNFRRYLKSVGPEDGGELVKAVETSWLPDSNPDVRLFALRMVGDRSDRINLLLGLETPCDPLWFEPPSVFQRVRAILNRRSAL